jgi:hypothetical protein
VPFGLLCLAAVTAKKLFPVQRTVATADRPVGRFLQTRAFCAIRVESQRFVLQPGSQQQVMKEVDVTGRVNALIFKNL